MQSLHCVAETLSSSAFQQGIQGRVNMRGTFFKLANRIAYADYVVLRQDGIILDSSDPITYPHGIKNFFEPFMELAFENNPQESLVKKDIEKLLHYSVSTLPS